MEDYKFDVYLDNLSRVNIIDKKEDIVTGNRGDYGEVT